MKDRPENVRVVYVRPVNHLRHLLLTIVTVGLWSPVWIFDVLRRNMTR